MTQPVPPIALLAELTHRCPLMCPYCSNPLELARKDAELSTETWSRVFREAADAGVLQAHLSGGEPASRRDLEQLTEAAAQAGLYTNLITSGIGLTERRLRALDSAGLDHVQLSLQGTSAATADRIGGYDGGFDRKMQVATWVSEVGFPLTLNVVMHRQNLQELDGAFALADRLSMRRVEIACVQFHGWASRNRSALQPTREQVVELKEAVALARSERSGRMVIDFVPPDYYSDFPKACMGGWGSTGLVVNPSGRVLPCHAAEAMSHLNFATVHDASIGEIWRKDPAFQAYRGDSWMPELCRTCERKEIDFGGCRCQAMAIVGDPTATDPVCSKSPDRALVDRLLSEDLSVADDTFVYRR